VGQSPYTTLRRRYRRTDGDIGQAPAASARHRLAVTVAPNAHVMFRRLGDRMVLIHLHTNEIFDLNETSARLWELLAGGGDVAAIETQLRQEFDVDPDQLHREVTATLSTLAQNDLITGYDAA